MLRRPHKSDTDRRMNDRTASRFSVFTRRCPSVWSFISSVPFVVRAKWHRNQLSHAQLSAPPPTRHVSPMLAWLLSLLLAAALAWWSYRAPASGEGQRVRWLAALRALAWIIVLALLFNAPAGPRRAVPPIAALDASASWLRGGDSTLWRRAISTARSASSEMLLWGDSARTGAPPAAAARRRDACAATGRTGPRGGASTRAGHRWRAQ